MLSCSPLYIYNISQLTAPHTFYCRKLLKYGSTDKNTKILNIIIHKLYISNMMRKMSMSEMKKHIYIHIFFYLWLHKVVVHVLFGNLLYFHENSIWITMDKTTNVAHCVSNSTVYTNMYHLSDKSKLPL